MKDEFSDNAWINFGIHHDDNCCGLFVDIFITESWREPLVDDNSSLFDSQGTLLYQMIQKVFFQTWSRQFIKIKI